MYTIIADITVNTPTLQQMPILIGPMSLRQYGTLRLASNLYIRVKNLNLIRTAIPEGRGKESSLLHSGINKILMGLGFIKTGV